MTYKYGLLAVESDERQLLIIYRAGAMTFKLLAYIYARIHMLILRLAGRAP